MRESFGPRPSIHIAPDRDTMAVRSALAGIPIADTLRPWQFSPSSSG